MVIFMLVYLYYFSNVTQDFPGGLTTSVYPLLVNGATFSRQPLLRTIRRHRHFYLQYLLFYQYIGNSRVSIKQGYT